MTAAHPIEGQVVLLAGAKSSVTLEHLSALLETAQATVRDRRETYERRFERIDGPDGTTFYLVEAGHWDALGAALGLADREVDALRRTHAAQFRRDGRRLGRFDEFESALELRDVVAVEKSES